MFMVCFLPATRPLGSVRASQIASRLCQNPSEAVILPEVQATPRLPWLGGVGCHVGSVDTCLLVRLDFPPAYIRVVLFQAVEEVTPFTQRVGFHLR